MIEISANFGGTCLSCDEPYEKGDRVQWESGVGCWHTSCHEPRNLKVHKRPQEKRSVFDPTPFGQATPRPFKSEE